MSATAARWERWSGSPKWLRSQLASQASGSPSEQQSAQRSSSRLGQRSQLESWWQPELEDEACAFCAPLAWAAGPLPPLVPRSPRAWGPVRDYLQLPALGMLEAAPAQEFARASWFRRSIPRFHFRVCPAPFPNADRDAGGPSPPSRIASPRGLVHASSPGRASTPALPFSSHHRTARPPRRRFWNRRSDELANSARARPN